MRAVRAASFAHARPSPRIDCMTPTSWISIREAASVFGFAVVSQGRAIDGGVEASVCGLRAKQVGFRPADPSVDQHARSRTRGAHSGLAPARDRDAITGATRTPLRGRSGGQ